MELFQNRNGNFLNEKLDGLSERGESLLSKWPSLKRENHFRAVLIFTLDRTSFILNISNLCLIKRRILSLLYPCLKQFKSYLNFACKLIMTATFLGK